MMRIKSEIKKPKLISDVKFNRSKLRHDNGDWSWIKNDHATEYIDPNNPANYYESTMSEWHTFSPLDNEKECDVVVIGGGLLGASTALHLAESGIDTILLEKNRIGSAASGRNGGQITPGLGRWEAGTMIDNLAHDDARRLWQFSSVESISLIDEIAAKYGLELDRKNGHITAANHPGHLAALTQGADARKHLGDENVAIIGSYEIKNHINSDIYHGGVLDSLGGHVHSLALTRGLIYGFVKNGGTVHEKTEVISLEETEKGIVVKTTKGNILAKKSVVLAIHDSAFKLLPESNTTAMPFYTYVGTTNAIDGGIQSLLPTELAVYDTQIQIDYYRPARGQRLLFGGQGTGIRWNDEKTVEYLTSRLRTVFPERDDIALDLVWSGTTDFTLNGATDCRKFGRRHFIYSVHGWSGHGIAQTVRIGKAIRDDMLGLNDDFAMLTNISHRSVLMGRQLAPLAIPLAKSLLNLGSILTPGKMISF